MSNANMSLSSKERIELFKSSLGKISNEGEISSVRNLLRQRYLKAKENEKKAENEVKEEVKESKRSSQDSSVKLGKQLAEVFRFGKPRVKPVERRNHRAVRRNQEELDPLLNDPRVLFENFAFEELVDRGEQDGQVDYDGMPFFPERENPMEEEEIEDDSFVSLLVGWWKRTTWTRLLFWVFLLTAYAVGQKVANRNGFGLPFLMFAILVFICCNLRKKSPGELSAYSVFNPDCRPIQSVVGHQQPDNQIVLGFGDL